MEIRHSRIGMKARMPPLKTNSKENID